ncbi:MAG: sulfatase-like hydrolase/transferase [Planctomycetales bacterium]
MKQLIVAITCLLSVAHSCCAAERPNIVLILADDLGYSDLGCYGGEIETPHLDRMCREGMRFSQFLQLCGCAVRHGPPLMTGQALRIVGIEGWTGLLVRRCVTLFELLKRAGYRTGAVGRLDMATADNWHEPANIARYVDRFGEAPGTPGRGITLRPCGEVTSSRTRPAAGVPNRFPTKPT